MLGHFCGHRHQKNCLNLVTLLFQAAWTLSAWMSRCPPYSISWINPSPRLCLFRSVCFGMRKLNFNADNRFISWTNLYVINLIQSTPDRVKFFFVHSSRKFTVSEGGKAANFGAYFLPKTTVAAFSKKQQIFGLIFTQDDRNRFFELAANFGAYFLPKTTGAAFSKKQQILGLIFT